MTENQKSNFIMKPHHIMVDIESMGSVPGSAVLAIGAVQMDLENFCVVPQTLFYGTCTLESAMNIGLTVDPSTIIWWMQQSENARMEIVKADMYISLLLSIFSGYLSKFHKPRIWGNGSSFDNVLISEAYRKAGLKRPWSFRDDRDYRTIKNMVPDIPFVKTSLAHNAGADAIAQAEHMVKMAAKLYQRGITID